MAYTNPWVNNWAGTNPANQIDNRLSQALVDIEQRMDNILGDDAWSAGDDPTVDGTILQDIKTLTTASMAGFISKAGNVLTLAANKFLKNATNLYAYARVNSGSVNSSTIGDITYLSGAGNRVDPAGLIGGDNKTFTVPTDGDGLWLFILQNLNVYTGVDSQVVDCLAKIYKGGVVQSPSNGYAAMITIDSNDFGTLYRGILGGMWLLPLVATDTILIKVDNPNAHTILLNNLNASGHMLCLRLP